MPAINIVDKYEGLQYTGSNSAEFTASIANLAIVSATGGALTVESPAGGTQWIVASGGWARFTQGYIQSTHTNAEFLSYYIHNSVYTEGAQNAADIATLQGQVATLQTGGRLIGAGAMATPTLLLGASAVVAVDFIPAAPNTSYTPQAQLFGAAGLLGSLSITNVAVVDTNTINVTVQNSGIVNISGVHLLVTAQV